MTAPLTPTPLSEAVARLRYYYDPQTAGLARPASMEWPYADQSTDGTQHDRDVRLLLDAVAEGREDARRHGAEAAIAAAQRICESRSRSLMNQTPMRISQGNEAHKCAAAIRCFWRDEIPRDDPLHADWRLVASVAPPPAPTEPG